MDLLACDSGTPTSPTWTSTMIAAIASNRVSELYSMKAAPRRVGLFRSESGRKSDHCAAVMSAFEMP